MAKKDESLMPAVSRFVGDETPTIVEGDGAVLVDEDGTEYIDFFGQHATMSHGYSHPKVVDAVVDQFKTLNFSAYDFPTNPSRKFAQRLAEFTPGDLERAYFVNSGSEAVEVALSLARKKTGNHEFLALSEAFHGRTLGARSLVGWHGYRKNFGPFVPDVTHVPSHNCDDFPGDVDPEDGSEYAELIEYALKYQAGDVAAFIAEPMMGTAGNIPAPKGYFERVREICDDHDILFIADEVITGFGRTGERFGIEHYDVEPDIMTMAKALGGGMPIGATVATAEVADAFESMDYFSTFGGNPVATAAGLASVETIEEEGLVDAARKKGKYLIDRLHSVQADYSEIGAVRGKGLFIGVDLVDSSGAPLPKEKSMEIRRQALDRGVILPAGQGWRGNTIRISPPLIITTDQIDVGIDVLCKCLDEI